MIYSEGQMREKIRKLYEKSPVVHISVTQTRPRVSVKNAACTIIGVYLHFFCVEEASKGLVERHCIRYADILSKRIQIEELND